MPEVVLGLPREPDNDIGGQGHARDGPPNGCDQLLVVGAGIAPIHPLKHPVAARLHRQVDMLADLLGRRDGLNDGRPEVTRVRGHVADPPEPLDPVDPLQEPSKAGPTSGLSKIAPIRVDVLAKKGYFSASFLDQILNFSDYGLWLPAPFPPPDVWDDTIAAIVVTPVGDGDPGFQVVTELSGQPAGIILRLVANGDDRTPFFNDLSKQIRKFGQIVRAEDKIHVWGPTPQRPGLSLALGQATANTDDHPRTRFLEALELPQAAVYPGGRAFPDGTRIQDDDVGLTWIIDRLITQRLEHPGQPFRVVLIHLATESHHVIFQPAPTGPSGPAPAPADPAPGLLEGEPLGPEPLEPRHSGLVFRPFRRFILRTPRWEEDLPPPRANLQKGGSEYDQTHRSEEERDVFVRDEMTAHAVSVKPTDRLRTALDLMQANNFEGLPVLEGGVVVGVITMWDLLMRAVGKEPSFIDETAVGEVMSTKVITVNRDEIIEEAAYLMYKHDLDILPVVDEAEQVVGVISENDLFRVFVKMLGLKERGTRISVMVEDRVGQISEITRIVKDNGISIASIATTEPRHHFMNVVLRLRTTEAKKIVDDIRRAGFQVLHVSQVWE